jgi:hypothetical protein
MQLRNNIIMNWKSLGAILLIGGILTMFIISHPGPFVNVSTSYATQVAPWREIHKPYNATDVTGFPISHEEAEASPPPPPLCPAQCDSGNTCLFLELMCWLGIWH